MKFKSAQIKGKGRGKLLGFPTINLEIPPNLALEEGIYAVRATIEHKIYSGALHFGPVPTFTQNAKSLEVFIINEQGIEVKNGQPVGIEIISYIRKIKKFPDVQQLKKQIEDDVSKIKTLIRELEHNKTASQLF